MIVAVGEGLDPSPALPNYTFGNGGPGLHPAKTARTLLTFLPFGSPGGFYESFPASASACTLMGSPKRFMNPFASVWS